MYIIFHVNDDRRGLFGKLKSVEKRCSERFFFYSSIWISLLQQSNVWCCLCTYAAVSKGSEGRCTAYYQRSTVRQQMAYSSTAVMFSNLPTSSVQAGRSNVNKALHGQDPRWLTDECRLFDAAGCRQLPSSDAVPCLVPRTCPCHGDRAFPVARTSTWKALGLPIRLLQPCLFLGQFRRSLKQYLFDCDCRAGRPAIILLLSAECK